MGIIGSPIYEWLSHNLFVLVLILGSVAAMGAFWYYARKKKGWYRKT